MTNTLEFKAMLVRKGLTLKKLSEEVGISSTSLSYKINNRRDFMSREIVAISKALNLTSYERDKIFFKEIVDK